MRPERAAADNVLAGVILAGGRSVRMGGTAKALLRLGDKPLLRHVIERASPQVDELLLSVERFSAAYEEFGLRQVVDLAPNAGPLGGLLCAMRKMDSSCDWLLLVPCDAPFLPFDLAAKLQAGALTAGQPGAVIRYESEIQPVFSIWNRALLPRLERAVIEQGMAGFKQFLAVNDLFELDWPNAEPPPFFNINDRDALDKAGKLVKSSSGIPEPCST